MEMTGESRIEAPRDRVWQALNDPEVLKASIDGCEELEKVSDTEFTAKVRAKVGPVSARFGGKVTLSDLDPPNGYRIAGEGTGGVAGFAKGGATVRLEEDGGATVLRYQVQATVGGKLAQIGSRLIDSTARKRADDFFARFKQHVEGSSTPGTSSGSGDAIAGASEAAPAAPSDLPSAPDLAVSREANLDAVPGQARPGPEMARAMIPPRTGPNPLDVTPGVDPARDPGAPQPTVAPSEVPPETRPTTDDPARQG